MKRFFILTFMLCCCMLQGFAEQYTDANGVTWTFYSNSDGTAQLTGASNYGAEVIVPEKVSDGTTEYTTSCLYNTFIDSNIKKVTLPKVPIRIDGAFSGCMQLAEVVNSDQIISCGNAAFVHTNIKTIDLSNCEYIRGFNFCYNLETVILKNCKTIGSEAFQYCSNLKNLGETTSVTEIETGAFSGCRSLASLNLPSCMTWGTYIFQNCTNLKEVFLPESMSEIPDGFFQRCSNLASFDFSHISKIGTESFEGCNNLTEIILSEQINSIGQNAFGTIEKVIINATNVPTLEGGLNNTIVFVPKEALNAYKTADNWKDYTKQIFAIGEKTDYDITTTALDNAPGLLQQLNRDSLNYIVNLKVSGTINGYDIMLFRNKMDNLHNLDLSDADIVANPYEYYEGCCTQDSVLGDNAFVNLNKLISIYIPKSIKVIGGSTFYRCRNLKNIIFQEKQNLKIGDTAFMESGIETIKLPIGTSSLGYGAFLRCTSLTNAILPEGLAYVPGACFDECGALQHIELPTSIKRIEERAFKNTRCLGNISLPSITYIGENAFFESGLQEIKLPPTLESIDKEAFNECGLQKVYTYTVLPVNISQSTFSNFENISLYVPTQSVDNYYLNTQWSQFKEIHEFDEPYTYFYLDKEFTLEKRFDGTPDIDIKEDGGLKVDGKDNQEAGDVTIKGDGDKGNSGTLITDGNLNAKKMRFDITVTANKWYFFSFPFDINFADVKAPGEYKWKRYDGSIRADQGSGGWVDLANNEEWLKQGDGYIFQTNKEGILTLRVTKEKFGQLDANNIMKPLDSYPSDNNIDASWNFIGNPQTSYFNVNDLGYEAPITVWNGSSYEAVRPGDDDYTLHPFQAFFVQKPTATSGIEFKAEDRLTKTGSQIRAQETKARRLAKGFTPSRMIINLSVTDGTQTDKTRVVFNDKKSRNYELDCDAAKFMTMTTAPQLYSVEGKDTKLAINERPMGSVQLGFTAKKAGTYTISAARMDQPMLLQDNQTGITFDLTNGDYEFSSGAGIFDSRFMLMPSKGTTGIADIIKQTGVNIMPTDEGLYINGSNGNNVMVYNLNGMEVANRNTDGMLNLTTGVYIVKVNGVSTKVMVK